ncbi:MAG TPA: phosphate acyltransferase PlsX [Ilumatobacteraceae bacterium]|nr:phosphate acyltransferase PlsX [Ilumatobacteraceae bacterium]
MQPVAVDAMGGDRAPGDILAGIRNAVGDGVHVVAVCPPELDLGDLAARGVTRIDASETIAMDEDAANGVRRKKDSTLVRCAEAVRDGKACAMVSAGNTGATMASALLRMGRIKGVNRPAIAVPIPIPGSDVPNILLDAGANAEVHPDWLVQFAQMGSVYARLRFGLDAPKVGLLSIGEEPGKGDSLRKEAFGLLSDAPGIDFIGNVEGRDMMTKTADVVVTDGFTGNVVLKTLEGGMKAVLHALLSAFAAEEHYKPHADALLPALLPLHAQLSPDTYGGAMLLGVDGVCIISHGSSNATAIRNAINLGHEMAAADMVGQIRAAVSV